MKNRSKMQNPYYKSVDLLTGISAEYGSADVSLDSLIHAEEINADERREIIEKNGLKNAKFFNIGIYSQLNKEEITKRDNEFTVSIPLPDTLNNERVAVYYYDGSQLIKHATTIENGRVYYKTNHFSEYILALDNDSSGSEKNEAVSNPETNDCISYHVTIFLASVISCLGVLLAPSIAQKTNRS